MPARVNKENFDAEVLSSEIPVLVDFFSDSCVPCKKIALVLSKLESEYADRLKIVKVNVNFDEELAVKYNIEATPTLLLLNKGDEVSRLKGAVSKDEIVSLTDKIK
ncbi:thioredoxin domain-containing protein [Ruminococcus sp. HUN007]|uniref:thioredoxin family protein n=1 Tax=Ruminococcus sp. HUN007 TaxID=1514668 RepID=UPI0005D15772|nr:thioredoxin domain-containing protein [Ruminococcus sp. HUN007]